AHADRLGLRLHGSGGGHGDAVGAGAGDAGGGGLRGDHRPGAGGGGGGRAPGGHGAGAGGPDSGAQPRGGGGGGGRRRGVARGGVGGGGLRPAAEVRVEEAGVAKATAKLAQVVNSTDLTVRWDLTGVALGTYDVVAINGPDRVVLPAAFTVEAARPAAVAIES